MMQRNVNACLDNAVDNEYPISTMTDEEAAEHVSSYRDEFEGIDLIPFVKVWRDRSLLFELLENAKANGYNLLSMTNDEIMEDIVSCTGYLEGVNLAPFLKEWRESWTK